MAVYLIPQEALTPLLQRMAEPAIRQEAMEIKTRAEVFLQMSRPAIKIGSDPNGLTDIGTTRDEYDWLVWMEGQKNSAMAIEMGHQPSGVFSPGDGSRAPRGLYILTRASGAFGGDYGSTYGGRRKKWRRRGVSKKFRQDR